MEEKEEQVEKDEVEEEVKWNSQAVRRFLGVLVDLEVLPPHCFHFLFLEVQEVQEDQALLGHLSVPEPAAEREKRNEFKYPAGFLMLLC